MMGLRRLPNTTARRGVSTSDEALKMCYGKLETICSQINNEILWPSIDIQVVRGHYLDLSIRNTQGRTKSVSCLLNS